MDPLNAIQRIDYTVVFARDLGAMRAFYETVMGFALTGSLGSSWFEYRLGPNTLALSTHAPRFTDPPPETGALSLQLAFRVEPHQVAECAAALEAKGVRFLSPVTDQPWGHRTLFFRDPDGNVLEIYAEI